MLYLGIDIAKNNNVASLINGDAKPIFKAFSFANTTEGGESLLAKLDRHAKSKADIEIGMEATGHYWLSLYSFLVEKGFAVHVVNPFKLTAGAKAQKSESVRLTASIPF